MEKCSQCNADVLYAGICTDCFIKNNIPDNKGKFHCGGCNRNVEKLFECYVANKLKYRCILCYETLKATKKTFRDSKISSSERKYGSFWKLRTNAWGNVTKDKEESETTMAKMIQGSMQGARILTIRMPYGENATKLYPSIFVFQLMGKVKTNTFKGVDKDTGTPYSREMKSVEIITNVFDYRGKPVHSGICRLSDTGIISDIESKFKDGNGTGAIGFYVVDNLKDSTDSKGATIKVPDISSFWLIPDDKEPSKDVLTQGYQFLNDEKVLNFVIDKLSEVGIEANPLKWGFCFYGRYVDAITKYFTDKEGELIFSAKEMNISISTTAANGEAANKGEASVIEKKHEVDDEIPF